MDLPHSVRSYGIGGVERYGRVEVGVEATVCIEQTLPSGNMVGIAEGNSTSNWGGPSGTYKQPWI